MQKRLLLFLLFTFSFFLFPFKPARAAVATCPYSSTQAKVKLQSSAVWKESLSVQCGQVVDLGGFHNNAGKLATGVTLKLIGPGTNDFYRNGTGAVFAKAGSYTLKVTTNNSPFSASCVDSAIINVSCPNPTSVPIAKPTSKPAVQGVSTQCQYSSTQARVQKDINDPWKSSVNITCGQSFNIGSFHDGTGQFATDTALKVVGPNFSGFFNNGQSVLANNAGNYTLTVSTNNQSGSACTQQATVYVTCPEPTSTPTPTPAPVQQPNCSYSSTQARVQKDISDPWKSYVEVSCFESFNVGSFHNNTGQFANDTDIYVRGPFMNWHFSNADRIPVAFPGFYDVTVTTRNQSGASCTDTAMVKVYCSLPWMRGV